MLLIDSDLRKPAFKASNDRVGLSKLLTTDDPLQHHIVETQHQNLWLLPSGPLPPNPADLLSTGRIRKIIGEAKDNFDIVVIDGPPTLGLADAPLLASAAGSALFVIEAGKTRTRAAIEALNRLEATGTRILGAALTKSDESSGGYGRYGYGYGYGYGPSGRIKKNEILMIPHGADSVRMRRRRPTPESGGSSARGMIVRTTVAIIAVVLLAIAVIRNAAVASLSQFQPEAAAKFWKSHPATQASLGMNSNRFGGTQRDRHSRRRFRLAARRRPP